MAIRKYKEHRILLFNNPFAPRICPALAEEIGLNESIVLLQLEFWLATEGEGRDDGYLWLRRTVREIQQEFSFWGTGTVGRIVESLVKKELIVTGDFDDGPGKSGRWVRLNLDRLTLLKSVRVLSQSGTTVVPNNEDSVPTWDNRPYSKDKEQIHARGNGAAAKTAPARRRPKMIDPNAGKAPLRKGYELAPWALSQVAERFPGVDAESARVAWMGSRISRGTLSTDWDSDFVSYCASINLNRQQQERKYQQPIYTD